MNFIELPSGLFVNLDNVTCVKLTEDNVLRLYYGESYYTVFERADIAALTSYLKTIALQLPLERNEPERRVSGTGVVVSVRKSADLVLDGDEATR